MFGKLFLKQNCKFCEACSRERGGGMSKSVCIIRKLAKYIAYRILEIKAIDIQKDMLMNDEKAYQRFSPDITRRCVKKID